MLSRVGKGEIYMLGYCSCSVRVKIGMLYFFALFLRKKSKGIIVKFLLKVFSAVVIVQIAFVSKWLESF